MRHIKKVLTLHNNSSLSLRDLQLVSGLPKSTVGDYIRRFKESGLSLSDLESHSDAAIYQRLFSVAQKPGGKIKPDFSYIHQELKKKGVTRQLLWEEYKDQHPQGMGYTQFCYHFSQWSRQLEVSMRQVHKAGEKLFIDYSGLKGKLTDPQSGEVREVDIFVSALGASGYTFAEASPNQKLFSFIDSHLKAFEYYEGVPEVLVPDNLKSAVSKAHCYDPVINATYQDMADHYGCVVLPARPYKPQDKSKVELAVKLVQRWILARIRNEVFYSIEELNQRIGELLVLYNHKKIRQLGKSRYELFMELDKPALGALPLRGYEFKRFQYVRVNRDYHIQLEGAHYSVPYQLCGKEVLGRYNGRCVEVIFNNKVVALHAFLSQGGVSTQATHMPQSHQRYALRSASWLKESARAIGEHTGALIEKIIAEDQHPERGYRSAYGILRAAKAHQNSEEVELAAAKMLALNIKRVFHFESILKRRAWAIESEEDILLPSAEAAGEEVRGGSYYH